MEQLKPTLSPDIFKEQEKWLNESFLENSTILPEDYYELATLIAKDSEVLYATYHNLFSLQQDRSSGMIDSVLSNLEERQQHAEDYELPKIQRRIEIATKFKEFLKKYSWQDASNTVHTLEQTLK